MNFEFLRFLASPWFVLPWYGFGILAAIWVIYDEVKVNRHVMPALKAGWPIIMVFFSIIGLLVYLWSCRPPGAANVPEPQAKQIHHEFVSVMWKKVTGSVIHCVGGDGLGIISAMVVCRAWGLPFWTEFWIEYAVGFVCGWFIFQMIAFKKMGSSTLEALWKGGRAEFFSMITVMIGMGLVMRFVTPGALHYRPKPDTFAFWGFVALGLLVGAIFTYPMNWLLVKIGWKHGMG